LGVFETLLISNDFFKRLGQKAAGAESGDNESSGAESVARKSWTHLLVLTL